MPADDDIPGPSSVFERSLNPMLIADDDRRLVDANDAASRLLGLSLDEIRELSIDDLTPPQVRPQLDDLWMSFLREGSRAESFTFLLPSGDLREVEYSATAEIAPGRHLAIFMPLEADDAREDRSEGGETDAELTARERQILTLVALGQTSEQVAEELFISPETVRTHLRNARRKLGATTKAHAVALALVRGDIEL